MTSAPLITHSVTPSTKGTIELFLITPDHKARSKVLRAAAELARYPSPSPHATMYPARADKPGVAGAQPAAVNELEEQRVAHVR
jgi:hypothetical protein